MRTVAIGQCRGHGIAIAPTCSAHPLQKAGLIGGHRTQQHRRQIAYVHPHLQRGGGRQQILKPGLRLFALEAGLQFFTGLALQQAGVLCRDHAAQVALAVALCPPVDGRGHQQCVAQLRRIQARHAHQVRGHVGRHGHAALAVWRGHKSHLGVQPQPIGVQGPGIALVVGCSQQQSRRFKRLQGIAIHLSGHAPAQERLLPQYRIGPAVVPGGAAHARELVKA